MIKKKWTLEEDKRIVRLYLKYKTRWSEIARHVEGRTDNQIKNRFNSNLKKRLQDKEFCDLVAADSSDNEEGSEDSVTFDGGDNCTMSSAVLKLKQSDSMDKVIAVDATSSPGKMIL